MISDKYSDLKIPILKVIQTIRNIKSKAWNDRNTNNWIVQEITGHGHGVSTNICNAINIDPYGYSTGDDT